jgi:DNA-binding NtrC family response regulator
VLARGDQLTVDDFTQIAAQIPGYVDENGESIFSGNREVMSTPSMLATEVPAGVYPDFRNAPADPRPYPQPAPVSSFSSHGLQEGMLMALGRDGGVRTIAAVEEELIRFALRYYRGQMSEVARRLGIGRSTLYRKLKDYGIDPDDPMQQNIVQHAH